MQGPFEEFWVLFSSTSKYISLGFGGAGSRLWTHASNSAGAVQG